MNYVWKTDLRPNSGPAAPFLPPALVEETAWDILLALHSDAGCKLSLDKLAAVVSAPPPVLNNWLALFEERHLITGEKRGDAQELWAVLTPAGRQLLDHYISVTSDLQLAPLKEIRGDPAR